MFKLVPLFCAYAKRLLASSDLVFFTHASHSYYSLFKFFAAECFWGWLLPFFRCRFGALCFVAVNYGIGPFDVVSAAGT